MLWRNIRVDNIKISKFVTRARKYNFRLTIALMPRSFWCLRCHVLAATPQLFPWQNSIVATEDSQLSTGILTASPKTYHIFHTIIQIQFTCISFVAQVIASHLTCVIATWRKGVQTYFRSTMSEILLSNLACISINPELVTSISIRELQQPFLNAKTRRIFEWLWMNKHKTVPLYNSYVYKSIANM